MFDVGSEEMEVGVGHRDEEASFDSPPPRTHEEEYRRLPLHHRRRCPR